MRKYIKYLFMPVILSAAGCMQIEEEQFEEKELVTLTFEAVMEGDQTKTSLGGNPDDSHRNLTWLPTDEISVARSGSYSEHARFTNVNRENSEVGNFTGDTYDADTYYAAYPYSAVDYWQEYGSSLYITLPLTQTYARNTFATDVNPMVARAGRKEVMEFKNLCGILVVNLKGAERVKTVSLAAYDESGALAKVAGKFCVDMNYETDPVLAIIPDAIPESTQGNLITMDCGEGVQINPAESTPFHFVIAPGSYSKISVLVTTVDGKVMIKEGKNPLTIRRAEWVNAGALQYVESISVDLSEIGNSNCYIVPKAGAYSFDADIIGNGEYGFVEGATFHTANPAITPASAELLWEDRNGVISAVTYKDKKISFLATGQEGNAAIAAKDESGNIIWSWHIWVTDQPQEQVYVNEKGTFTMLDRNIGATRADRGTGEEYRQSSGVRYQWGRKDPYTDGKYTTVRAQLSIAESIQLPTTVAVDAYPWAMNWDRNYWTPSQKTIYDPCPVGYRVPPMDVWYGFSKNGENVHRVAEMNVVGEFDNGFNFIYDGTNTAWYPATGEVEYWGGWVTWDNRGRLWSAENDGGSYSYYLNYYYASTLETELYIKDYNMGTQYGYSVRCMKDLGHVDTSYPTVKLTAINNITSTGATIVSRVTDEGISGVTERGIVWGTTEDVTLGTGESKTSGTGFGEYSITLSDLAHSTRYYVRAYATNERGTSYSKAKSFYTPYEGNAVNLSKDGTANCYIVPPVYSEYVFNAAVKGNSEESVGTIAEAVVLWQTRNDRNTINEGDVIESVELNGSNVHFTLPFEPKPGNALIAVKDALGTILWSWHIWVVDFDPVATQQTYASGAVMMDRNLGALNVTPGDIASLGLFYQWGRKDPFVGGGSVYDGWQRTYTAPSDAISYVYYDSATDTIENAVKNPTVVYNDARWGDATDLWGYKKTKYDPCPSGWRVSDLSAWEYAGGSMSGALSGVVIDEPCSVPAAYIPYAGMSQGDEYIHSLNDCAYIWLTERQLYVRIGSFYLYSNTLGDVDYMCSVRCMKDDPSKDGSNEGYTGSDYEW